MNLLTLYLSPKSPAHKNSKILAFLIINNLRNEHFINKSCQMKTYLGGNICKIGVDVFPVWDYNGITLKQDIGIPSLSI